MQQQGHEREQPYWFINLKPIRWELHCDLTHRSASADSSDKGFDVAWVALAKVRSHFSSRSRFAAACLRFVAR